MHLVAVRGCSEKTTKRKKNGNKQQEKSRESGVGRKLQKRFLPLPTHNSLLIKEMARNAGENLFVYNNRILLFPSEWIGLLEYFSEKLNVRDAGTTVAEI